MNILKNFAIAAILTSATLVSTQLLAQTTVATTGMEMSSGEVRKVDKEAQKITLKHGEIKNMEMPPMTMVFKVLDRTLLEKINAGDKVNFNAEKRDGAFVVTAIEIAR